MDYILIEFVIAILMLVITFILLIKVIGEEVSEDIFNYKRRNHWKRWKRKRRKK